MLQAARARYVLCGVALVLLAVAAGSVFAMAPAGGAAAQPQPTIVLSPASGPCDATVEVRGNAFPPPSGPMESLGLYLFQPGTTDVNMEILNAASVQRDGSFSQLVPLSERGCEAAALDSQAEQPKGNLFIAARSGEAPVQPGERIPDIVALAAYAYTTTTPHVPTETLAISPASGPCDGAVEVTGSGFSRGEEVPLDLARPNSDDVMGTLAAATADSDGKFSARVSLGDLGCDAAALDDRFSSPGSLREIEIYAGFRRDVLFVAARARYAYTTTAVSPEPQSLPSAGSGPGERSTPPLWFSSAGALAGLGVTLLVASLYRARQRG